MPQAFYAVARGVTPGIYFTWDDAEKQVKGFPNARFKRFPSAQEAQTFIEQNAASLVLGKRSHGQAAATDAATTSAGPSGTFAGEQQQQRHNQLLSEQHRQQHWVGGAATGSGMPGPPPVLPNAQSKQQQQGSGTAVSNSRQDSLPWSGSAFYALANGKRAGIYTKWADIQPFVQDVYSARYKKFATREEAEEYIRDHQMRRAPLSSDPDPQDPSTLVAFCDGSATKNGTSGCRAAFSCVFPHNPDWDRAEVLTGFKTNNRAEYLGALAAMQRANIEDPAKTKPLYIYSDSMLLIRSMTEWLDTWIKNNWCKADGTRVLNEDLLRQLVQERGNRRIIWQHVKAHTGGKDWKSVWNDKADRMAQELTRGAVRDQGVLAANRRAGRRH